MIEWKAPADSASHGMRKEKVGKMSALIERSINKKLDTVGIYNETVD